MKKLLINAVLTALKAGDVIMSYYNQDDFILKKDKSPVTKADIKANEIIENNLKLFSNYEILSEEGCKVEWEKRKKWNNYWLVDPLDGTKEFLKKNGEFTVNIALVKDKKPVLGVIFLPAKKKLYYALEGFGSFKHNYINSNKKINFFNSNNQIFTNKKINNILKIVASRSHLSKDMDKWLIKQKKYDLVDAGSSIKFCLVAEGTADVYPRFVGSSEWDIAAGYIILKESGGITLDVNKNNIKFNKKNIRNPYFIASSQTFIKL